VVVVDEAYVDFGAESCLSLIREYDNLLVTQTFSKSRSLAGGRLGFGAANPEIIRDLETIRYSTNPYNIDRMTLAAGVACLENDDYNTANCRTIAATREKTLQYGSAWIGKRVADCSGLFTWAFRQLGGTMYHGSNTMYLSYCSAKGHLIGGKRADGKPLLPGTAMFIYNSDKAKYTHVGVYVGDGLVIEAMGAKNGVTTSKPSKWGFWGELKGVDYSDSKPDEGGLEGEITPLYPTLKRGSKGDEVKRMQQWLLRNLYNLA
jgi:hypothetical protein